MPSTSRKARLSGALSAGAPGIHRAKWGASENNRRAKFYTLTAAGRRRLDEETAGWNRLADAIGAALNATIADTEV